MSPDDSSTAAHTLSPQFFFDVRSEDVASLFDGVVLVWDVLDRIDQWVHERLSGSRSRVEGDVSPEAHIAVEGVFIEAGAVVEPGASIAGPSYIAAGARVRHGAYVRGGVIMFADTILGHVGEAKNAILLPGAHAPHFAYVGDSVLGHDANLGAGTKLSNLAITSRKDPTTLNRPTVSVWCHGQRCDTGRSKFGAVIGDHASTGCNVVLNPGTLLGPGTLVYPCVSVARGVYPANARLETTEGCPSARL
jgi:UDP-N-acetylglucosamine diphosphorylase / glucose-1-phosphate thymidylyltransferase / UDP-N-acetylgalactosamine diphosphorylase / glucosamine-1-phosphate N-acetyltransferase / galactosamine-1-phosphate N-acetyltransferase